MIKVWNHFEIRSGGCPTEYVARIDYDALAAENEKLKASIAFASGDGWNELPKLRAELKMIQDGYVYKENPAIALELSQLRTAAAELELELEDYKSGNRELVEALKKISESPQWEFQATDGTPMKATYSFNTIDRAVKTLAKHGAKEGL